MPTWPLLTFLAAANQQIVNIATNADAATVAVQKAVSASEVAARNFADTVTAIRKTAGPFAGFGEGDATGGSLLSRLEMAIRDEREMMAAPYGANALALGQTHADIQKIVELIREWSGPAGLDFTLEKYKTYLDQRDAEQARNQGDFSAELKDAVATVVAEVRDASAGISLNRADTPARAADNLPTDVDLLRARDILYKLDDAEDQVRARIDEISKAIESEDEKAAAINASIEATNHAITEGEERLRAMADAAGVNEASGAGGKVKALSDSLKEAQDRLQYLRDKGAKEPEIAAAESTITKIQAGLADAEKALRIATYEFEHSDAFKKQQEEIVAEKKKLEDEKKALAAEAERQKAVKERAEAEQKRLAEIEERKRKQQEILDARRRDEETKQRAEDRKAIADALAVLAGKTQLLGAYISKLNDAPGVKNGRIDTLRTPSPLPPVSSGHTPKVQPLGVLSSTAGL